MFRQAERAAEPSNTFRQAERAAEPSKRWHLPCAGFGCGLVGVGWGVFLGVCLGRVCEFVCVGGCVCVGVCVFGRVCVYVCVCVCL